MSNSEAAPRGQPGQPVLTQNDILSKPWRYLGYKHFSEWLASDADFFIIRRFDSLTARVMLNLQWELTKLETKLGKLDHERSHRIVKDLHNGSIKLDDDARQDLIKSIYVKLKEYHRFVNEYSSLRSKSSPTTDNVDNIKKWLKSHSGAIAEEEALFVEGRDDLVRILATDRSPLRQVLEKLHVFRWPSFFRRARQHQDEPLTEKYNLGVTVYHSNERIEGFVALLICLVGFALLVAPLWILFFVSSRQNQLIVITIFVAFFLAIIQSVSVARPFESLAATAGYSAVLMVFMQIQPQNATHSR